MAQQKLALHKNAKLKENFYIKSDCTRVYYFSKEEVQVLFEKAGFRTISLENQYRLNENRRESKALKKTWRCTGSGCRGNSLNYDDCINHFLEWTSLKYSSVFLLLISGTMVLSPFFFQEDGQTSPCTSVN
jgi:hypothetical protein